MFKVECPGCKAPYQVDERRIPTSGLKMRCPKCGTSFKVDPSSDPQRTGPSPVLGGVFGMGADSEPPPAPPPVPARNKAIKSTMLGVAPATAAARPAPPAPAEPPASASASDLPALFGAPEPNPSSSNSWDLPSPAEPRVDLPSPVARRNAPPMPPRRAPQPAAAPTSAPQSATLPRSGLPSRAALEAQSIELDLSSIGSQENLPAPRASADLPAVAPRRGVPSAPFDLDLPSVTAARIPAAADSPGRRGSGGFGELELDLPSAGTPRSDPAAPLALDLPSPLSGAASSSISLPSLPRASAPNEKVGLPAPAGAQLPSAARAGLPSLAASLAGLGSPADAPGLPLPRRSSLSSGPTAVAFGAGALPAFGELELPLSAAASPSSLSGAPRIDELGETDPFGEAVLPAPRSLSGGLAALATPAPAPPATAELVREAGGGTAYGEVNLGSSLDDEFPLEAPVPERPAARGDEDMEFANLPQEQAPLATKASSPSPARRGTLAADAPRRRSRLGPRVFASIFALLVGGAALALVPAVGPFGAYWVVDQLKASDYERLTFETVSRSQKLLGQDTAPAATRALLEIEAARSRAKRVRSLTAYAAFLGLVRELRFGSEPEVRARAKVLLAELDGYEDVEYLELARAARAASEGQLARARQMLQALLRANPKAIDALVLRGEVELRARDAKAALVAWEALSQLAPDARSEFGLARARFSAGDTTGAEGAARQALQRNPEHVGARILLARIASPSLEREPRAVSELDNIAQHAQRASPDELVSAQTLLGDIHLGRSRISRAEAAYTEALKISPKAGRALTGLGEALYRAGRFSEAQARFEAGSQADPDDVLAKVGVAKSKLMLERLEEAHTSLKGLRESHPNSIVVAYWYGRALEAAGKRQEAGQVYARAIQQPGSDPVLVDTYVGLALLQNQQGKSVEAQKTLSAARDRLPRSPAIHRALGDVALSQGRYAEAKKEFQQALALDAEDLAARFRLGVTLRRDGSFDDALKSFDQVAAIDPDYPGLALERGLLFEASGRNEEATKAYEIALAKAPEDPDLMLRVGCSYAAAARAKEAQELLRKVLAQRPTSAETNHCLGRALLAEGSRLADALRLLDRAVEVDPNRAEYHLYVGWAANEAGNVPKAERALDQAIKLDQGLADAYWQRGVLRGRQGAVRDSIQDLTRALQLRPNRHEAHAALADAYYDLGREQQALTEWQIAVAAQPENATWHFRYGKLLVANHMNEAARLELGKALDIAGQSPHGERWAWEAHHLLARAFGMRADAVPHWEEFLKLGPLDSPYRAEAKASLEKLGRPWSGN